MVVTVPAGPHQGAVDVRLHRCIRIARDAVDQSEAGLLDAVPGAVAEAAADYDRGAEALDVTGHGPVTVLGGVYYLGGDDLPIVDLVDLDLLRPSEMLENLAVLVCHCDLRAHGGRILGVGFNRVRNAC